MDLKLSQNLNVQLAQQLKLSPQLIQRIEILQLPTLDLKELIQKELMENEVLEMEDPPPEPLPEGDGERGEEGIEDDGTLLEEDLERLSRLAEWNEGFARAGRRRDSSEEDPKMEAMQNTASRSMTLQDHLKEQLDLADADEALKGLAEQIIFNIDERGYLLYPLEEIALALPEGAPRERLEEALRLVQGFEPRGVGARDLKECLLLQVDDEMPRSDLVRRIIMHHMEDVSRNRLPKVARETGESLEAVQAALERISRLDPIPGRSFRVDEVPYVYPDVVVELVDGEYEVRLEDTYFPVLGINPAYFRMMRDKRLDPKLRRHIRQKIESARWLIESIEQRKSTLAKVVREVVDHQRGFLDHGVKYLKPLKMQEIADKLGIHVSTVSRAISDKYVQTHRGIFPLKFFFTGGTRSSDGNIESRAGVKQKVKEIIDGEDKHHPLSDEEIVKRLRAQGLDIARRTVTKYRKALKIPSSRQRKVY